MTMRKIFTLCVGLLAGLAVQAQSDFPLQFVDKDGQIIPDGTELDILEYEEDELFGDILMPTNVWVKNISDGTVQGGGSYTIQKIDNGSFQTCFPSNCMRQSVEGTFSTGNDAFMPGQLRNMQTEWLPTDEGICVVTYQLQTYSQNPFTQKWMLDANGPTITLNYFYGTTGINEIKNEKLKMKNGDGSWYDLRGRQVQGRPSSGVYIMTDGKHIRKVAIK